MKGTLKKRIRQANPTLYQLSLTILRKRRRTLRDSFNFVFLADSRGTGPNDPINVPVLSGALACAARFKPLFILHGGDLAYWGTQENLRKFRALVDPFVKNNQIPFFAIPANHEVYQTRKDADNDYNLTNFKRIIGPDRYTIQVPAFHFRILAENNVTSLPPKQGDIQYGFSQKDLRFIKEASDSRDYRNQIVAMHAPISTPRWAYHSMDEKQTEQFLNVVNGKNEVQTVLVSHIHAYDEAVVRGVRYVLSGGAGAPLEKERFPRAQYHIVVFRVTKQSISKPHYVPLQKGGNRWQCR